MHRRRLAMVVAAVAAAALLWAPATLAATQAQVVADCNAHGQLTQQYTLVQLRQALAQIPPAIKEYTNCYDVIQRQLAAQLGTTKPSGNSGGDGGGGSFLPTPVIIILVVLAAVTAGYAVMAVRRRGDGDGEPPESE